MHYINLKYAKHFYQSQLKNASFLLQFYCLFIVKPLLKTPSKSMKRATEKHLTIFHQINNDILLNRLDISQKNITQIHTKKYSYHTQMKNDAPIHPLGYYDDNEFFYSQNCWQCV